MTDEKNIFSMEDMDRQYVEGFERALRFLRDEGIICEVNDRCGECSKIDKFLKKLKKKQGV